MIRTYAYKDIKIGEIFAREEEKTNVADVVSEIIAEVTYSMYESIGSNSQRAIHPPSSSITRSKRISNDSCDR